MMKYDIPMPPSINHYYFTAKIRNRLVRIVGKAGKEFHATVKAKYGADKPLFIKEEVLLFITIHNKANKPPKPTKNNPNPIAEPTKARKDIDNILKPTLDSLIGIAYTDDKQVSTLIVKTGADTEIPYLSISVYEDNTEIHKLHSTLYFEEECL